MLLEVKLEIIEMLVILVGIEIMLEDFRGSGGNGGTFANGQRKSFC